MAKEKTKKMTKKEEEKLNEKVDKIIEKNFADFSSLSPRCLWHQNL